MPPLSLLALGDSDLILRDDSIPSVFRKGSLFLRGAEPKYAGAPLDFPPPSINSASRPPNECICVSPDVDSLRDRSASDHAPRDDAPDAADVADVADASDPPDISCISCCDVAVDRIDRNSGKHGVIGVRSLEDEDDPDKSIPLPVPVPSALFLIFFVRLSFRLSLSFPPFLLSLPLGPAPSRSKVRFRRDAVVIDALLPIRGASFPGGWMLDESARSNGSEEEDDEDDEHDEDDDGEREMDPECGLCSLPELESEVPESWLVWMATGRIWEVRPPTRPPFPSLLAATRSSTPPSSSE